MVVGEVLPLSIVSCKANMDEKNEIRPAPLRSSVSVEAVKIDDAENAFEVFQKQEGKVDFRTVGWVHASVIFLKGWFLRDSDSDLFHC